MLGVYLKRSRPLKFGTIFALLVLGGCATLTGLGQYDSEEQRAWEEASVFMLIAYRNLDDGMGHAMRVQTVIDVGERYIKENYPQHIGYLALSENLAEVYSRKFIEEGYKPRLRFIYTMVMKYIAVTRAGAPGD